MVRRGQIWWADLAAPKGSEPGYRRPVVIVQADDFNVSRISTVIAVMITSNLRLAEVPSNVLLPKSTAIGLSKDSVVNVTQIAALDRDELLEQIGQIDAVTMRRIDQGLRLALAL
jgi:mRNA interferase MazF